MVPGKSLKHTDVSAFEINFCFYFEEYVDQ